MNLEALKKNNQIVQESQVIPSVIKLEYYLIEPIVLQDLYQWNMKMKEDIAQMRKKIIDTEENITRDNIEMNEQMKKAVGENQRLVLLSEARFETNGRRTERENYRSKVENGISNILGGIVTISNMVSNSQVNHRPKRQIRRYRTLSKHAMKEYAMKKANSRSFDWFEDEEEILKIVLLDLE